MAIFKSRKKSASASLQTKTATADTDDILVIPDTGYDGMSSVTVHPTPTETKTVTATTSSQTVTPASGKYLSEVTVNPQAHTTTYTPSEDTASNDMGANHDYRYVDTSGMITPSGTKQINYNGTGIDVAEYANVNVNVPTSQAVSILPSNSSPRPIYYGNDYHAEGNGYAIASYDSVTPSSIGDFVSSGDIVKFGGNGVILDLPPGDITPSNDTPEPLRVGGSFKVTTNGFAIESIDDVIYPYYDPQAVSADSIVKINSYNGYVIDDYDDITPSSTPVSVGWPNVHINGNSAMIVDDIIDLTPTSTPESVSSGDNIHFTGSGVIVDSIPTPTSITPSNANPVALSSGVAVEPTANGYAIQSYDNITPPSSPQAISSGDILKMIGNGYVIDTYSTATPSDSTPPQLSQGNVYVPTANGYLYENQQGGSTETVLWTNNSPTSTFAGQTITLSDSLDNYTYVKIKYRISTSVSTESSAIVPVSEFVHMTQTSDTFKIGTGSFDSSTYVRTAYYGSATTIVFNNGYKLGSTSQANGMLIPVSVIGISVALPPSVGNVKVGTFTNTDGVTTTVDCGFKPKKIFVYGYEGANVYYSGYYDEDINDTYYILGYRTSSSTTNAQKYTIGGGTKGTIDSITNTGFTWYGSSTWAVRNYVALG